MSIDVRIKDSTGTGNGLKINGEGEVGVVIHSHPPDNERIQAIPFRQYFTDDGTICGCNDMRVTVCCGNVEFYIGADPDKDIYIKSVSIVIADQNAVLDKFGAVCALTNGVLFEWKTSDQGTVIIHEGLKSNFNFIRLAGGSPSVGDAAGAFRASNVTGSSEGYIPIINMTDIFGFPWGLRIRRGSTDSLSFTIRDATNGVDLFNAIGYGIKTF